ncbi:hypothetical protein, partial [Lentilactobacillus farraginis]|uniref:hypothetical protein n=1 Tax=Lentilactobacillus farraginis TaxID=390841 RepID=UPI001ED996EE
MTEQISLRINVERFVLQFQSPFNQKLLLIMIHQKRSELNLDAFKIFCIINHARSFKGGGCLFPYEVMS